MSDKIMAVIALATLLSFMGVVAWFVPHPDLIAVVALVGALVLYDFWNTFRTRRRKGRS
jgi:threonine/homoserine/homoserine lactone efflux protein